MGLGRVMPFFRKHSRSPANCPERARCVPVPCCEEPVVDVPVLGEPVFAGPVVVEPAVDVETPAVLVAAAFACEEVLPEEPPHAVKPRLARVRTVMTPATGVRKALLILGIELLIC